VLGTTTPLYTLLLAGLAGLSGQQNYPSLALLVNAAADAAGCAALAALAAALSGRRSVGLAAALLWAIAPMSVTFAIGGMETSVFVLLLTLSALAYVRGRTRWAAASGALVLLTRPDGALLVAPMIAGLVAQRARERRFPWAEAGVFLALLAPWAVFASLYFGSPIPNSIAAKTLAYRLPAEAALVRLMQHYGTPFFEHEVLGRYWPLAGLILYLTLSLLGGVAILRRRPSAWPVVIFPAVYFIAYAAANPLIFRWYLAPPLPIYFILILAGIQRVGEDLGRVLRRPDGGRWANVVLGGVTAVFVALSLRAWTLNPDHGPSRPAPVMAWHQLELIYTEIGEQLAAQAGPQTVVAAGDVGALGYYSGARILDTVGLMSPVAAQYYPLDPALHVISYAIAPKLIADQQPDFVVLLEVYGRLGLLRDPGFQAAYELAWQVPTDIYGSDGMLIFRRRAP
jgi:hypothetical protein